MNIYEEAIKDLNDNEHNTGIDLHIVRKALERAKKVEELLGLYQSWVDDTKNDLWEVIRQKEKELEKLK